MVDYPESVNLKPTFYIDSKTFPKLSEMRIGEECEVIMKVITRDLMSEDGNRVVGGRLEIVEVLMPDVEKEQVARMTNKEFMEYAKNKKKEI